MRRMREEDDLYGAWNPWNVPQIKTKNQVLAELSRPCSRFGFNPGSIKSDFTAAQLARRIDPFANESLLWATGTPANWQFFAQYLHEKGITGTPDIHFYNVRNDIPKMYHAYFQSHEREKDVDGKTANRYGYGCSFDQEEAVSKATGELLERHFLAKYRNSDLIQASYAELIGKRFGPRPIDIFMLNGFLPEQETRFPILQRSKDSPIRWVLGKNVADNKTVYIPAQLVFWNYADPNEMFLAEANSNGAAGGFSLDEAILAGVLEYIQRDGFVIHWLKVKSPKRIDLSTIADESVNSLLQQLQKYGLETHLIDVTTDVGVPSCVCVILDRRADPSMLHMGGGIGFNEREVFLSAIKEAVSGLNRPVEETISLPASYVPFSDRMIGLDERLRVWRGEEMLQRFAPFISGPLESATQFMRGAERYVTSAQQFEFVKNRLNTLGPGYEIFFYEVKEKTLRTVGFNVVKVVIPKLVSLYLWDTNAPLASERLSTVPSLLGYKPRDDINPWPHPFP